MRSSRSKTKPGSGRKVWTAADVRALGVRTGLETAGQVLGMGRSKAHELARTGRFPVPVLKLANKYIVPTAPLLELLHLAEPDGDVTSPASEADHAESGAAA